MKRYTLIAVVALSVWVPARPARALQENITLGARVGTLGLRADLALALNERVAIRGGAGFVGFNVDVTERSNLASNRTARLSLPALHTVGAEFTFGPVRAGAGVLIRSGDPVYTITYGSGASIDIGGGYYRQPDVLTLTTTLVSRAAAPYALIGFGSNLSRGLGLVVDVGAAFARGAGLEMAATGFPAVVNSAGFRADLEAERRQNEDDVGGFLNFWPIFNIGLRYGLR